MKKHIVFLFATSLLLLASCASGGHLNSRNNPIASLFEKYSSEEVSETSKEISASTSYSGDALSFPTYDSIDVDLTSMNATMVYSEVYNMMNEPSTYIDKIVKVSGPFVPFESTNPDYCYPAIMIQDATACCANGLEFLLYGVPRCSMEGGNGYPLYNEEATIVGKFATYLEDGYMYVHLVDAIWLK